MRIAVYEPGLFPDLLFMNRKHASWITFLSHSDTSQYFNSYISDVNDPDKFSILLDPRSSQSG